MQINYTGRNIEITPSIREFAEKKLQKLGLHHFNITAIDVVFKVEKLLQIVEATILANKIEVHASAEDENLYTAIDLLIERLEKQLIKHKEKIQNHRD